jgi:uncharacterized membrane protein
LFLKLADGLLECIGGIILLIFKPTYINHLAAVVTHNELSTDPHDFIANHILNSAHNLTTASLIFGALYLLSHGIIKIVLVIEVLRNHLWAYVALLVVTSGFVIYQVYRMVLRFSVGLFALTLFDLVIIYLTQKEYRRRLNKPNPPLLSRHI